MVDPAQALVVFAVVAALVALVAWPRHGLGARLLRAARLDERVRLEDALKHAYMCGRRRQACTVDSLAGHLGVSPARAVRLLSRMSQLGLVRTGASGITLTERGSESAVRILRTHRLWERYLADRTGLPAGEWHDHAERMEHALTAEQADALDSRLGHPRWDPHGDPIPTSTGELPPVRGISLLSAEAGTSVEVVHLEDEPPEVFDSLLRQGLAPGSRVDVVDRSGDAVRLRAAGREWELDPLSAGNVTVRGLPPGERAEGPRDTLADAVPLEPVRVMGISASCQGTQRRRLLDLGVVPGTEIVPELVSATGDPVAYRIRGALVALRGEQARWIQVEPAREMNGGAR
jgi:DtxR family Mn-dependent transcriptional regulator